MRGGLRYVHDTDPGIRRVRVGARDGTRFRYLLPGGRRLRAPRELKRIASLAIPPAYEDVWICRDARGHVQATGRDARGRKQYRYHPQWHAQRDQAKFGRMIHFARALPRLRRRLRADLRRPNLPREKVLAVIVTLLDVTLVRIGNDEYARSNNSFGLTTLRDRHVRFVRQGRAVLQFRGKSGLEHDVTIDDRRLAKLVRSCQELPGQRLFQFVDDGGVRHGVDSGQVNDYLRETMGEEFTAKDFRTWAATVRALALLAELPVPEGQSGRAFRRAVTEVIARVAKELRNTPAVCRKSYINPAVFEVWRRGELRVACGRALRGGNRAACERRTLAFLRYEARRATSAAA